MSSSHPPHTTTDLKARSSSRRMWQESKRLFLLFKSAAAICVWRSQGQKTWLFLWVNYSRTQEGLPRQHGGCILFMLLCRNQVHCLYWRLIVHMKDPCPASFHKFRIQKSIPSGCSWAVITLIVLDDSCTHWAPPSTRFRSDTMQQGKEGCSAEGHMSSPHQRCLSREHSSLMILFSHI